MYLLELQTIASVMWAMCKYQHVDIQDESKFYCFGGIETAATAPSSMNFEWESKFYCFGGIETSFLTTCFRFLRVNLNSTASAVLRQKSIEKHWRAFIKNLNSTASAVLRLFFLHFLGYRSLNLNSTASAVLRQTQSEQEVALFFAESKFYCFGGIEAKEKG